MPKQKQKPLFEELRSMRIPKLGAANHSGDKLLVRVRFDVVDGSCGQIYILEYDQIDTVYTIYIDFQLDISWERFKLTDYQGEIDYIEIGDNFSRIDRKYKPQTLGALLKSLNEG